MEPLLHRGFVEPKEKPCSAVAVPAGRLSVRERRSEEIHRPRCCWCSRAAPAAVSSALPSEDRPCGGLPAPVHAAC